MGTSINTSREIIMQNTHESKKEAIQRSIGLAQKNRAGSKLETINWNAENFLRELKDTNKVESWRNLAIIHAPNLHTPNKGQILKEWARNQGVDVKEKSKDRKLTVRRKRLTYPESMAMPSLPTKIAVRTRVTEMIKSGIINIGEMVVPRTVTKLVLKDNKLIERTSTVSGRKISMKTIREKAMEKTKRFMRLRTNEDFDGLTVGEIETLHDKYASGNRKNLAIEDKLLEIKGYERTRSLIMWHDGSSILSHGYLLFMISIMFDEAVFFTAEELNIKEDIQATVEEPYVYMIAMCKSNDEQLAYSSTRLECLEELKEPIMVGNIAIQDKLRAFHGDGPAAALEVSSLFLRRPLKKCAKAMMSNTRK